MKRNNAAVTLAIVLFFGAQAFSKTKDLGNGFADHGVCAPISESRGTVAASDGSHDVVLCWLMDHRGCYELLMIDVDSGQSSEHKIPFSTGTDSPYASILSREGKFYTHFGSHFVEFDPDKRAFTFTQQTVPQCAMSMTEDDNGAIWSTTYPNCGVFMFDPHTRKFRDFGSVYKQNWEIYPRDIAADDTGWIYIGLGSAAAQILAFDPTSGKARPVLGQAERPRGIASVYRELDGKVYGQAQSGEPSWRFYHGEATQIRKEHPQHPKQYIAGSQGLMHKDFPDGKKLKEFDLEKRYLVVEDQNKRAKSVRFDYASEGAIVMGAIASPQGTITGGTTFPQRCFTFDPKTDTMSNRAAFWQWNAVGRSNVASDQHIFLAVYPHGYLLDWNTGEPWIDTNPEKSIGNPRVMTDCAPEIYRPACVLPLADGKTVVMGGTPAYGCTGGGLLLWKRETQHKVLLSDKELIPDQSTAAIVQLDDDTILAGTTTSAGTGGVKKGKQAELFILNLKDHRVLWHKPILPGIQVYNGLHRAGEFVVGIAGTTLFFVFDPAKREVIFQHGYSKDFGPTVVQQGPRVFITGRDGEIYLLASHAILQVEQGTWNLKPLVKSTISIGAGGDYLDGRIYFINGSHLYSWRVQK